MLSRYLVAVMCNLQLASMSPSSKTSRTFLSSDPPFWTLCLGSEARDKLWRADSLRGTLGLSRSQEARAAKRALHNGFSLLAYYWHDNSALRPAGSRYGRVARRPHQCPHTYIQGMNRCKLYAAWNLKGNSRQKDV